MASAASLVGAALAVGRAPPVPGNAVIGKELFVRRGLFCASCHTLKAAGSTGRDGQDLDQARPGYATIVELVTKGHNHRGAGQRAARLRGRHGEIPKAYIQDIAAFIYTATHK